MGTLAADGMYIPARVNTLKKNVVFQCGANVFSSVMVIVFHGTALAGAPPAMLSGMILLRDEVVG